MSPGLKRAREPYRIRNALTGIALGAFAVGIWAYSISAVKQDVFDDVDEEARAMRTTGPIAEPLSVKEEKKAMEAAISVATAPASIGQSKVASRSTSQSTSMARGLLQHLDKRFPHLLDPQKKTLVWGAPPIDNIGKLGRS